MQFLRDAVVTIIVLAAGLLGVGYMSLENRFSAVDEPGRFEKWAGPRVRNFAIPNTQARARSVFDGQPDAWRRGAVLYQDHCVICHGSDGRGRGEIGSNLYPRVPDLVAVRTQNLTDGQLFYLIANGVRWTGMPAWRREITPEETWLLVSFIRHLPALTPDELDELDELEQLGHTPHEREESDSVEQGPGHPDSHDAEEAGHRAP